MDNELVTLINSAEQSTKFREHVLNRDWKLYPSLNRLVAQNKCDGLLDSEGFCILCGDDTKSIWKDNND